MKALWLALAFVIPVGARAQVGPFAKPFEVARLDNGLTVITIPWQSPGIIAYYTLVRVGARDELVHERLLVEQGNDGPQRRVEGDLLLAIAGHGGVTEFDGTSG